jgi:hypothetical protein
MTINLLLVTYALRSESKDYETFFVTLRGNAVQWWHFFDKTHIVATQHDARALRERLVPHIEVTDSILIVPVNPQNVDGWLPQAAWDWIVNVSKVSQKILPGG